MNEEEIISTFEHWIEYEKANKDKINKAEELIEIQEGLLSLYKDKKEELRIYKDAYNLIVYGLDNNYISKNKIREKIRMYKAIDNTVGVRVLELLLEDTDGRNNEIQNKQ